MNGGKWARWICGNVVVRVMSVLMSYGILIGIEVMMLVSVFTRDYNTSFVVDSALYCKEMALTIVFTLIISLYWFIFIDAPINSIISSFRKVKSD